MILIIERIKAAASPPLFWVNRKNIGEVFWGISRADLSSASMDLDADS